MRRAPIAGARPALQTIQGNPRRDADDDRQRRALGPGRAQLLAHALRDLRLDGDDDDVRVGAGVDVVGRGLHACRGEFVAVDIPRLGDDDVLLRDAFAREAADDGGGHVAAADEGDLAFLEGGHCCGWCICGGGGRFVVDCVCESFTRLFLMAYRGGAGEIG